MAIVQRFFDAWNRNRLDSVTGDVDPKVEVDWSESLAPYGGTYRGHSGWLELFAEIRTAFDDVVSDAHDFVVNGRHVAVPNTAHMRGRDGVEVAARSTVVFTFLGVKLVGLRLYRREEDALAAIGC